MIAVSRWRRAHVGLSRPSHRDHWRHACPRGHIECRLHGDAPFFRVCLSVSAARWTGQRLIWAGCSHLDLATGLFITAAHCVRGLRSRLMGRRLCSVIFMHRLQHSRGGQAWPSTYVKAHSPRLSLSMTPSINSRPTGRGNPSARRSGQSIQPASFVDGVSSMGRRVPRVLTRRSAWRHTIWQPRCLKQCHSVAILACGATRPLKVRTVYPGMSSSIAVDRVFRRLGRSALSRCRTARATRQSRGM